MANRIIHIAGIGDIRFETSRRAKRINISIKPFKGVRVAVPKGVSLDAARAFAVSKKDWIQKHAGKLDALEAAHATIVEHFRGIDRDEAKSVIGQRLAILAATHGYKYNRLFIRNQKTRWGSCSSKNNISLNMRLVRLPRRLMDYIILHELVHTRIKDHSRHFYAELDRIVDNRHGLESELKPYEMGLF